jgi:hypothetical protein
MLQTLGFIVLQPITTITTFAFRRLSFFFVREKKLNTKEAQAMPIRPAVCLRIMRLLCHLQYDGEIVHIYVLVDVASSRSIKAHNNVG